MKRFSLLGVVLSMLSCNEHSSSPTPESYREEIHRWRQDRLTRLTAEDGWLTICALGWLHEGETTAGTDSSNDIILPAGTAPGRLGSFWLKDGSVRFVAEKGAGVHYKDSIITSILLQDDYDPSGPTILTHGTLRLYIIKRGTVVAVRVKNTENPVRLNFAGLKYFPIDRAWRVEGRFEPYRPPKVTEIPTMVGTTEEYQFPGAVVFRVGDTEFRFDAALERGEEDQLFIMFGDETNGCETYGAGRQLYADLPDEQNRVILDFNKAYNWPCVFTEYATCPLPPRQNRLPIRVEAGERLPEGHE